jgi:tRNA(Ile)-lysidine synthase
VPPTSASELTPPADLVGRFRRDLEALTGAAPSPERKLALAVSGGGDSLAMLLLAAAAYPDAVIAATVDHGLRPEAAGEAAFVGSICARLGVPHQVLVAPEDADLSGNLQQAARRLRYRLLGRWAGDAAWLAVAHQQDDVAETFLMRARRGAGVGGLAGMAGRRMLRPGLALVRPLLGWRRAELAAVAQAAGIEPVEDPSNRHPRFDRARMRQLLADTAELRPERLALAASNLRHAEDALSHYAAQEWESRARVSEDGRRVALAVASLPYEIRRRLARRAIMQVLGAAQLSATPTLDRLDALVQRLDAGNTGTIAGVKVSARDATWAFSVAPPRRSH